MTVRGTRLRLATMLALGLLPAAADAQISPGPLSRAHAKLEGSTRCLDCHDPQKGVAASKCLACHESLQRRVSAGKGLHARPEYRDCKTCHVEHQGVEYELVWWGKEGRAAFDHGQTGHPLAGKHRALSCEQCHKARSYLGAVADCASCHKDEHRGQFAGRACATCHTEQAWKPAPGFDHARTAWPLTGRHGPVACERCHTTRRADPANAAGAPFRVFRAVAGKDCASCHEDAHRGRLGSSCATCHTTAGWRGAVVAKGFDHAKTAYPLQGRHAAVACEKCHRPGRPMRVKHDGCADCHSDAHSGALARRAGAGRCEACHDVGGFRPARYGTEDHARSAYPLAGAHLAVACDQCHRPGVGGAGRAPAVPLRFGPTRCAGCHRDPHQGEVARFVEKGGCDSCHRVESWRQVAFDHGLTGYPLSGSHAGVACAACHRALEGSPPGRPRFVGTPKACEGCHRDPHLGQFVRAGGAVSCERCHTTESLKASRFDHSRDAAWPLDGAHARVACARCHRPEARNGATFVRYKPLPTTCRGCHGASRLASEGGRR